MKGRPLKGYYSINQTAEKLGMTRQGVHKLIDKDELKPHYVDTHYLISDIELERFIKSRQGIEDNRYKIK